MGYDLMSMNACLMAGKQAGLIGILTTLAKKLDILGIVAYDEIVSMTAKEFCIPIFKTIYDKEFVENLSKCDLLISIHGREIVPKEFLSLPKIDCINVHPCLYKYKGKNPIQQLLKDKSSKASVGVHYMTEKIDGGETLIEEFVDIKGLDGVESIYNALYPHYSSVLSKALDIIERTVSLS